MTAEQERQAADLMRLAQEGDQGAYARLLVMLTSITRGYARGRLGAVSWIDDVVQETLLTIHLARHTYDGARPFAPWFYAIARSRLVDAVRRQRRTQGHEVADEAALAQGTTHDTRHDDVDIASIRRALNALPPRHRDIVESMKYRDESVRDIAVRLGLTESAVKVTAHRAYRALRKLLGGQ